MVETQSCLADNIPRWKFSPLARRPRWADGTKAHPTTFGFSPWGGKWHLKVESCFYETQNLENKKNAHIEEESEEAFI